MKVFRLAVLIVFLIQASHTFALEKFLPGEEKERSKVNTSALIAKYAEAMSDRQAILAENVANANTPHYKAEDMDLSKIGQDHVRTVTLGTTNKRHILGQKQSRRASVYKTGGEKKLNGNDVNLPEQMAKIAANQDRYNEAIRNYMVTTNLVSSVLGQGGS